MNSIEMRKLLRLREHRKRMDSVRYAAAGEEYAAAEILAEAKARESENSRRHALAGQHALYDGAVSKKLDSSGLDRLLYRTDRLKADAEAAAASAGKARQALGFAANALEQARRSLTHSTCRVFKTEKLSARCFAEAGRQSEIREELDLSEAAQPKERAI